MANRLKDLLLAATSAVAVLALAEGMLRFTGFRYSSSFYQRDFELGWKPRPGAEGVQDEEGETRVAINGHGMRDRARELSKGGGVVRVALLGDSFTEAKQVELNQTFGAVAEEKLKGCPAIAGRTPEVLNFGVSHYGTAQELMTLESKVWPWQPDVIVLAFFTGNDVYNNHAGLNPIYADTTPYYRLVNGNLERVAPKAMFSPVREWLGRAANWSRLAQLIAEAWLGAAARAGVNTAAVSRFGKDYPDRLVYHAPDSGEMREAWDVTEALIAAMHRQTGVHNAKFLLMTMTTAVQVHPEVEKREEFRRRIGSPANLEYPDRRLEGFAAGQGIASLILLDPMRRYADETRAELHGFRRGRAAAPGFGHWNETGHRVAGEALAAKVCELLAR